MILIYLSYADSDKAHGEELKKRLNGPIMRSAYHASCWSMQDREQGKKYRLEMAEKMGQASIFVPLVSSDYLTDERCLSEMMAALRLKEEGRLGRVIPLLLRPYPLQDTPLARLQVIPRNGKALTAWKKRDDAWYDIQGEIVDVIKDIRADRTAQELE